MTGWRPGRVPRQAPPPGVRTVWTSDLHTGDALVHRLILRGARWLLPTSLGSMLISGLSLLVPLVVGRAVDTGVVGGDLVAAGLWCAVILVLYALRCVATALRLSGDVGANIVEHDLRRALVDRLLDPRGLGGPARLPGDLVSVASTDVSATSRGMTTVTSIPGHLITVGGSILAVALLDLRLGGVVVLAVPLIVAVSLYGIRPIRPYTRTERTAEAAAAGSAADVVAGLRVVQGLRAQARATGRFAQVGNAALAATLRTRLVRGLYTSVVGVVVGLFIAALTVLAAYLGLIGALTVGGVVAVAGLAQTMGPPLRSIGVDTAAVFSASQASADRVVEVLQTPGALTDGERSDLLFAERLSFRGVTLAPSLTTPLNLDLDLRGMVAVVAPGAVAGALADLLARRRAPESGAIWWGDIDLATVRLAAHRSTILAPPHRIDLFDGTLASNVISHAPEDPVRLAAVLAATTCDEVARSQRDGLDTRIGSQGRALSGGQRQRVALARALYRPAPLLVLHEPTTSVDAVTTARIAARLSQLRAGQPTILLTTSPEFLASADDVLHLDAGGRVLRRGSHADLLTHPGYMAALA